MARHGTQTAGKLATMLQTLVCKFDFHIVANVSNVMVGIVKGCCEEQVLPKQ